MQTATQFAVGNNGITIPEISEFDSGPVSNKQYTPVFVTLRVPTLNAGVHTVASSDDNGSTWMTASGPVMFTGFETPNPTAAGNTGNFRVIYGPYVPGTKIRVTSSAAQTANISAYFMV